MNIKRTHISLFLFAAATILIIGACSKDPSDPTNPYSSVNYNIGTPTQVPVDPTGIDGLHKTIFSLQCANPGCHDGTFEPDFRTIQSSYNTLVYKLVIKNNLQNTFTYRVVPNDTDKSVLYERVTNCCFVNKDDRMPQSNIGTPLPDSDIKKIATWIMNGAKDVNGNTPIGSNSLPWIEGFAMIDSVNQTNYTDLTNRIGGLFYNPFKLKHNRAILVFVQISDDTTLTKNLKGVQLKMSLNKDDFSSPLKTYDCKQYLEFTDKNGLHKGWLGYFNSKDFTVNSTVYLRFYCNDGSHTQNAEFPKLESTFYYKTIYSFYVEP